MKRLNLRGIPAVISASVAVMFSAGPVCAQTSRTITVNGVGFEMVYVQGGTFTMEPPEHHVTLSDYYIGKYEVTQAQWKAVMGGNPSASRIRSDCPVENVSWNDAQKFIQRLNGLTGVRFALPTEAQWEYAARGGNKSHGYKYSGGNNLDYVAWHRDNSFGSTHPVGGKAPNELGLYDMTGNVREWCADWYEDYSADPQVNPEGPSQGGGSVVRGGDYHGSDEANEIVDETALLYGGLEGYLVSKMFRAAEGDENSVYYRDYHSRASTYSRIGFRLVLLPPSFPFFTSDKTELAFSGESGCQTVTVTSNRDLKVWSDADWLTVAPSSVKASGSGVEVQIKASINDSGEERTATVHFSGKGLLRSLTVFQKVHLDDIETVYVKGGTLLMGLGPYGDHIAMVTLPDYYIGKYEVTQAQWQAVMESNPSDLEKGKNYPVENVSWDDIQEFIQKLNEKTGKHYALPTEAQWEYAARGGNKSHGYEYSGSDNIDEVAWYPGNIPSQKYGDPGFGTQPVGGKAPNELGLYDMSGNVTEWCADWLGDYSADPTNPASRSSGFYPAFRGGSWQSDARNCRVSYRSYGYHDSRSNGIGFRLALPVPPSLILDKTGLDFRADGGVQTVTVTSNRDWTMESDADWLVVSPDSGKLSDKGVEVKIKAELNDSGKSRTATVTLKEKGCQGEEKKSVLVTQEYSSLPLFVLDRTGLDFRADGGVQTVTVGSNRPWTAQSDADWLVVSPSSGGLSKGATVQINVDANSSTSDSRTATVTFRSEGVEKSLTVFQEDKPYLELSRKKLDFSWRSEKSVTVTSNRDWTMESSVGWSAEVSRSPFVFDEACSFIDGRPIEVSEASVAPSYKFSSPVFFKETVFEYWEAVSPESGEALGFDVCWSCIPFHYIGSSETGDSLITLFPINAACGRTRPDGKKYVISRSGLLKAVLDDRSPFDFERTPVHVSGKPLKIGEPLVFMLSRLDRFFDNLSELIPVIVRFVPCPTPVWLEVDQASGKASKTGVKVKFTEKRGSDERPFYPTGYQDRETVITFKAGGVEKSLIVSRGSMREPPWHY